MITLVFYGYLLTPFLICYVPVLSSRTYEKDFYAIKTNDTYLDYDIDSDNDGLSDYEEINKYLTNPLEADTDNDGIKDNDWDERYEHTRVYKAIVDLRQPYSIDDMNDFYQDARAIQDVSDEITRFEIILYPDASEKISPAPFDRKDNEYTRPTFSKNYSESMKRDVIKKIKNLETDLQVLIGLQNEFNTIQYYDLEDDLGYSSSQPLQFQYYKDRAGRFVKQFTGFSSIYPIEKIMDRVYFADTMYYLKSRGACSSSATIRGAIFRAAGLEEQTIFTIPLFYSRKEDETIVNVDQLPKSSELNSEYHNMKDHFFNIVKIGDRWIRVDTDIIDTGVYAPYIKLLSFHDQSDYQWDNWNQYTYFEKRPYRYILIEELLPKHIM